MNKNAEKVKRFRNKQAEKYRRLKESSPCKRCGERYPHYVMDYHHRDRETKSFKLSRVLSHTMAWSKVLEEIAKCDLLCANCHRFVEYIGVSSNGKTTPC